MMKKILVNLLIFLLSGECFSEVPSGLGGDLLNSFLTGSNITLVYGACQQSTKKQMYFQLLANPNLSAQEETLLSQNVFLECLYGQSVFLKSICFDEPAGCQPFQLLIPTLDQIHQADKSNAPTSSTNIESSPFSNLY